MTALLRLSNGIRLPVALAYTHRTSLGEGFGHYHQCVVIEGNHGIAVAVRLRPPWPGDRPTAYFGCLLTGPIRELASHPVGHEVEFDGGSQVVRRVRPDAFSDTVWHRE
jgi:hypothetical protein